MNIFSVHKALLDRLRGLVAGGGGLPPLYVQSSASEPPADSEHLTEYVLNSESLPVGVSDSDSDIMRGFYQIDVNYPKRAGRFKALEIADQVAAGFPKGLKLTHGGQQVKIGTTSWSPVRENDLSNVVNLRIRFSVIG